MGPTASGKTALATTLYQKFPIDIISVDSAMIYQDMNIGTAKPTFEELAVTPHALINIKKPTEIYSAAEFRRDALACIEQSLRNNRIPFLVGGTMLYFKSLLEGLSPLPSADPIVRTDIEQHAKQFGWQSLHDELQKIDPVSAQRIHPNDPQRLSRALEVFRISGKTLTELTETKSDVFPYQVKQFAIAPASRDRLHQYVEKRFYQMLEIGFEQEVKNLHEKYFLPLDLPSMRCVGYRQMSQYLSNQIDYNEMIFKSICATRQLAKRQLTWLRSWQNIDWLASENLSIALKTIKKAIEIA